MTKWYQKASVQTAMVTGLFSLVLALGSGVFILYQENSALARQLDEKVNDAIVNFSRGLAKASGSTAAIDLAPDFSSRETAVHTLKNLNEEAATYDTEVNLVEIHRYIRKYGTAATNTGFGQYLNDYADAQAAANGYLLALINDPHPPGSEAGPAYAELLNARSRARTAFQAFIINLRTRDFDL